jgi:hypothetical protein
MNFYFYFFMFYQKKYLGTIHQPLHVCELHKYMAHQCIYKLYTLMHTLKEKHVFSTTLCDYFSRKKHFATKILLVV